MKPALEFLLPQPLLGRWRTGNTGVEGVWRFTSPSTGPHVVVTVLVHGNELCGAWAAMGLLELLHEHVRLQHGQLTVAFCNLAAFDRFDVQQPDAARFVEEDMNRQWQVDRLASGSTAERRRAAQLLPWLQDADYLVDLHSMHEPGSPLLLTGSFSRHVDFVRKLEIGGHVVIDGGHADGVRLRDFGSFSDPDASACSLLIECGWHGDPGARRVAEDAIYRLMQCTGLLSTEQLPSAWRIDQPPARWALEVTDTVIARSMDFRFIGSFSDLQCLPQHGTLIAYNTGEPVVTPYDDCVLVMPSLRQLRPGVTVVRFARRRAIHCGE
jgi:predicted deacylase